jgi:hypothetical protein
MSLAGFLPSPSRILPALLVGLFCAAYAVAQQPPQTCKLKVENSPELRGFRLGMSLEQIRTRFPKARFYEGNFGQSRLELQSNVLQEADPEKFRGVETIFLDLLDGRVVSVSATYDGAVKWQSIAQFAAAVSEALKLPPAWEADQSGRMNCDGFQIFVNTNHIALVIPGTREIVKRRELAEDDKKRQGFRP